MKDATDKLDLFVVSVLSVAAAGFLFSLFREEGSTEAQVSHLPTNLFNDNTYGYSNNYHGEELDEELDQECNNSPTA